jgi:hypothetical protein
VHGKDLTLLQRRSVSTNSNFATKTLDMSQSFRLKKPTIFLRLDLSPFSGGMGKRGQPTVLSPLEKVQFVN